MTVTRCDRQVRGTGWGAGHGSNPPLEVILEPETEDLYNPEDEGPERSTIFQ